MYSLSGASVEPIDACHKQAQIPSLGELFTHKNVGSDESWCIVLPWEPVL